MKRFLKTRFLTFLFIFITLCLVSLAFAGSQQTSSTTASTLIAKARYILNEESAGRFVNTTLLSYLNDGIISIATTTRCLEGTTNVTLVSGTQEYSLSSIDYIDVETAMYDDGSNPPKGLRRIRPKDAAHQTASGREPTGYYVWNDKIGIDPEPTTTDTVIVYYYKRPSAIALSGTNPLPAHYDELLVEYVVTQALRSDGKYAKASVHWATYRMELDRYRVDFNTPTKEPEE